jgi:hypothetical protein
MRKKFDSVLLFVLAAGVIVRLWAMQWPPFSYDMDSFIAWGEHVWQSGPSGFYTDKMLTTYAPGYVFVLWLVAATKHAFFANATIETTYFLYRLPPLLFDLATTILIFLIVEQFHTSASVPLQPQAGKSKANKRSIAATNEKQRASSARVAALAAACYALNPAIIFNSATWGQVDGSFTFFMLLSARMS